MLALLDHCRQHEYLFSFYTALSSREESPFPWKSVEDEGPNKSGFFVLR